MEHGGPFGHASSPFKVKSFKYNSTHFCYYEKPSGILFSSHRKQIVVLALSPVRSALESAQSARQQTLDALKRNPHSHIIVFDYGQHFSARCSQFWTPAQVFAALLEPRPACLSASTYHFLGTAQYWDFVSTAWIGLMSTLLVDREDETVEIVALDEFAALVPLLTLEHWYPFARAFVKQISILTRASASTLAAPLPLASPRLFSAISSLLLHALASLSYLCHSLLPLPLHATWPRSIVTAVFAPVLALAPFPERLDWSSKHLTNTHPNAFLWMSLFLSRKQPSSYLQQQSLPKPRLPPADTSATSESSASSSPRSAFSPSCQTSFSSRYAAAGYTFEPDTWLSLLAAQADVGRRFFYTFKATLLSSMRTWLPAVFSDDTFDRTLCASIRTLEQDDRLGLIAPVR